MDSDIVNELLKFADDTKMFGRVEDEFDRDRLQKDLDMIISWSDKWKMEFNVKKCKLMHMGRNNRSFEYAMNGSKLQVANFEKDLGVIITV